MWLAEQDWGALEAWRRVRYTVQPPNKRRAVLILNLDSAIRVLNSVTVNTEDGLPQICAVTFALGFAERYLFV